MNDEGAFRLDAVLKNRRWLRRSEPFPHLLGTDVLRRDVHAAITGSFRELLGRGLSEGHRADRFSRVSGYDAYAYHFGAEMMGPLRLFTSLEWHDLLADMMGIGATYDIRGSLHHHVVGSANGTVHNDLNPGWFPEKDDARRITLADPRLGSYHHGDRKNSVVKMRQTVRAVAMLYYVANGPWAPGEGGETGLYRRAGTPVERPDRVVPPVDNSMLVFECTPDTYHAFLSNRRRPRNSAILWLHRPAEEAERRWGKHRIVKW